MVRTLMQAPIGITILKGEKMIVEMANETYQTILGISEAELVGRPIFESLPELEQNFSPILSGILKTGQPFIGNEYPVTLNRHGKEEQAYFNFVYHPLREEDESINRIMVVATEVTQQVRSRFALEQKDAQFRSLVNQSPIAMAIFRGPDFIIELANETLLNKLWRKTLPEVAGKKLLEVFPELLDQPFPKLMISVLETGKAYQENEAPAIINSHDGTRKYWLDFEYSPIQEVDGSISGIMVTVNDVSEKVLARQKIEMAEKRYRDLIDNLPVAVFTIDQEGFVDLYNQAAVNLWDRTPIKGVDKWCGSEAMATAIQENRAITTEAYVQRPDESLRHVIAHPQPIRDSDGNAVGAMNVMIDITDRIQSETALRASEEKFRVLANSMPQFIWTANPQGELNYFSQSVFDYSGFTEQKMEELGWIDIVHPLDREDNILLWVHSINSGNDFHFEHRFRNHRGEYRWQLSRAVPQKNAAGEIVMWVGTSTDIHDKKMFVDELQQLVAERTRALNTTNENLVRTNNELIQFAYVASHDLQEPLRKIQTFVSRIQDLEFNNLSEKGKDYFARIHKSANRTQLLIQDLLAFSRANTIEKKFEPTDLNEVYNRTREDLSELLVPKKATITVSHLPVINGISYQLGQLFNNLITNSVKFSRDGVLPVIHINSEIVTGDSFPNPDADAKKKYHHIRFSDNGIGFEPQFNERIFLVFQRLHNKETYEGTGIGLAICKRIAENHGGFITADGSTESGAVFNVYIPV